MSLYALAKRLRRAVLVPMKRRTFQQGSIFGENTRFDETARCANTTGSRENVRIGAGCLIRCQISVAGKGRLRIGDRVYIGRHTDFSVIDGVTVGDDVIISDEVRIADNNNHPTDPEARLAMSRSGTFSGELWNWESSDHAGVVIEDNVWLGERSVILKGVTVGRGSIVARNAVVTHDVPPYTVAAGNPARVVKHLREEGHE